MTLQPIKDVSEYKRLKQTLRDRFESDKTGDQTLLEEQTKKYKPLLSSQKELSKTMQDVANQIVESQIEGQTALQPLLPLLQNIQKAQVSCTTSTTIIAIICISAKCCYSITVCHSSIINYRTRCEIAYSSASCTCQLAPVIS